MKPEHEDGLLGKIYDLLSHSQKKKYYMDFTRTELGHPLKEDVCS